MPLQQFFPSLPWPIFDTIVKVVGFLGVLLLTYAILLEEERKQDAVFAIGASAILIYGVAFKNGIMILLGAAIFLVSGREFIQILRKKHSHSTEQVEKYKHPEG